MKQINCETGICFFRVEIPTDLKGFLLGADFAPLTPDLSQDLIQEWLEFGCIYVDGRRQRENIDLLPNQLIRLHTRHKRYLNPGPALTQAIVLDDPEFVVLDKPAGLPTHPTLDNFIENAKVLLERQLGIPLYTTHRLDIPTQGLLIMAKTPDAQRIINRAFSRGRVTKIYRSLNESLVSPGLYTHYIDPETRVPRMISLDEHADWWKVQLRVERSGSSPDGYWHEMTLLTGKTHQIRAQMAALGAPVIGDVTYGAERKFAHERIALECFQLSFTHRSRTVAITRPESIVVPTASTTDREVCTSL